MDQLKLRIWDTKAKCWRSGLYIQNNGIWGYWARNEYRDGAELRITNHVTQYQGDIIQCLSTRLHDAAGTEIFQYDIVFDPVLRQHYEVAWISDLAAFNMRPISVDGTSQSGDKLRMDEVIKQNLLVVGNMLEGIASK